MSREIKYRQLINGVWHYWGFGIDGSLWTGPSIPTNSANLSPSQQYTGLQDRNGKEIYEGDIVKVSNDADDINELDCDTGIGSVEWIDDFYNVSVVEHSLYALTRQGYVEVIGNIYENHELLEAK